MVYVYAILFVCGSNLLVCEQMNDLTKAFTNPDECRAYVERFTGEKSWGTVLGRCRYWIPG